MSLLIVIMRSLNGLSGAHDLRILGLHTWIGQAVLGQTMTGLRANKNY